ncbi:MAG: hypothetical protein ACI35T_02270 [Alistipes sp.]
MRGTLQEGEQWQWLFCPSFSNETKCSEESRAEAKDERAENNTFYHNRFFAVAQNDDYGFYET